MLTGDVLAMAPPAYPSNDFEVTQPPNDSVSALEFSPATMEKTFLISGSWDNDVRCWEVEQTGQTLLRGIQSMTKPILDVCWSGDGTKVFMASCDQQVKCWDLRSNQTMQVAAHDGPVSICQWIETPNYTCVMTGSWDKSLKFWDLRSSVPIMSTNLTEKMYSADVMYPIAVLGTASKGIVVYNLEGTPSMLQSLVSPLSYQHRCIALIRDDVTRVPTGFGLGIVNGRVGIFSNYLTSLESAKKFFSFKCHRRNFLGVQNIQDIYAVNDIKFHPVHGTIATAGSDGTYAFWDNKTHTQLMVSDISNQPITKCCFNSNGQIFAYSTGYDWSKGHEYNNPANKPKIYLKPCFEETKPKMIPTLD